jgi:L,D-peptidoglycan transpeptidase YkuD (ErfK/YbiS/YcfS/YnhG family)
VTVLITLTDNNRGVNILFNGWRAPCHIGHGGLTRNKREGDLCTPIGAWPIRRVFYRSDRDQKPATQLPTIKLTKNMGWSDDPEDPDNYNRLVTLPYCYSHEKLWRADSLYDICVELGYNDSPPIVGKGSAIFMHLSKKDGSPTLGCIALDKNDLLYLLCRVVPGDIIEIQDRVLGQ